VAEEEKKIEKKTCFVCNGRKAIFDSDGKGGEKHNFAFHIISGEPRTVCIECKMKLQAKRPRNGF